MSDSGMYLYLINLKDDQGFERTISIKVVIKIITIEDLIELSLESISTQEVDFTVDVKNCKLREVTEARLIFTGEGERN